MADGILAAVNENGNIDRFIDTKGGVHYIEPKRYEESVAKIDAAATKAKETVNSATEAVSECKAQTGACTQETARAKEIADTVESRITGIEGDIATLRDSVSPMVLWDGSKASGNFALSDSLSNWALIGVYVSINSSNDSRKTTMVPCTIPELSTSGYGLNGMSSTMSSTDIRDVRVSLRYVDDKTLSYNNVIKTTLYASNSGVQSTSAGRNVNGIVGLVRR